MPQSITSLQNEPILRPFRVCEIRRREGLNYETNWQDVSALVTQWPTISFGIDTIQPFSYRRGTANLSFRNDDKQFAPEDFSESRFSRFSTRYKTLCRISTGLEDTDGTRYPTTTAMFYGLFSDDIQDTELETHITVNDIAQSLAEFPASNIAGSISGFSMSITTGTLSNTGKTFSITAGSPVLTPLFTIDVTGATLSFSAAVSLTVDTLSTSANTFSVTTGTPSLTDATLSIGAVTLSTTGQVFTTEQILQTIRDYVDSNGNVLLAPFISSTAWVISSTGHSYNVATTTDLDGLSALDLIEKLALAENHVFYIDGAGNARFSDRSETASAQYTFLGPGEKDCNIISFDAFNEGIYKIFTKFTCQLSGTSVISTQTSFTRGDGSAADLYGHREFQFQNNYVTTAVAGSICSHLLSYFSNKRREANITTKYITQLNIKDTVTLRYRGFNSGNNALWGYAVWGVDLWSGYKGGITVNENYHITQMNFNLENFTTQFKLREVA